jgi:hypothetical protein
MAADVLARWLLSAAVGTLVMTLAPAAGAATTSTARADLAVRRITASTTTVHLGDTVRFRVVAVDNGPSRSELDVEAIESQGLRLVRMVCADGVSPDTPFCEYGGVPVGTTFVTVVVARVVSVQAGYAQVACTSSAGPTVDPRPANDCKVVRLTPE